MRNFLLLVKNYFLCLIGSLIPKNVRKTKNNIAMVLIFVGVGALVGLIVWQSCIMYGAFYQIGVEGVPDLGVASIPNMELLAVQQGIMMLLMLCFLTSALRINGGAKDKDVDLLLSMPIKRSTIVLAKSMAKYFFNLAVSVVILLPYAICHFVYQGFSFSVLAATLLVILIFPLLIVGLSHLLDYLTARLFGKVKGAAIYKSLFMLVILLLFLWGYMGVTNLLDEASLASLNVLDTINAVAPIAWFVNLMFLGKWINLLWLTLLCGIPFAFGFVLFIKTFDLPPIMRKNTGSVNYNKGGSSAFVSITKKEFASYFSTPIWLINTILGPILMVIATVVLSIGGVEALSKMIAGMVLPNSMVFAVVCLVFISMIGLTAVSCCSISLEGKNFWIIKSAPVKHSTVLFAKSVVNLILTIPPAVICSIILWIALSFTFWQFLLLLGISVLYSFIISFGGLLINLLLPKMKWESEGAVVKRSMSMIVGVLFGFALMALVVGIGFIFKNLSMEMVALISLGVFALILAGITSLLLTVGKKLYNNLEA